MKIYIGTDGITELIFNPKERGAVLALLKSIYSVNPIQFVKDAIDDLTAQLTPRITYVSHFHYCARCFTEIDDTKGDNFIHITTDDDDKYVHRECPVLKDNRP